MILINMKGGLGNQLFQYATGRALAIRNTDILKLDITGYGENNGIDTMRHYSLQPFNIKAEIASADEIRKIKYPYGIVSKGLRFFRTKILRQFNVNYNERILLQKGDIYLDGFFQTEKYFESIRETIRQELTLRDPLGQTGSKIADEIKNKTISVSLHVRRGDYVQDAKTNEHHGTCNADYYKIALEYLAQKIGKDFHVFVFSDDINWVRDNVPIPFDKTYVSDPSIKDYEELILMSLCKHNIIANSSFSWWGAWLNQNPNKIVIAPTQWVQTGKNNFRDIVPPTWIRL